MTEIDKTTVKSLSLQAISMESKCYRRATETLFMSFCRSMIANKIEFLLSVWKLIIEFLLTSVYFPFYLFLENTK